MPQRRVIIATPTGLHARPAAIFAQKAATLGVATTVARVGGDAVDASSILSVMSLGLNGGEEVILACDGEHEDLLDALAELLSTNLDVAP